MGEGIDAHEPRTAERADSGLARAGLQALGPHGRDHKSDIALGERFQLEVPDVVGHPLSRVGMRRRVRPLVLGALHR